MAKDSTPPRANSAENKAASAAEVALLNEKYALSPSASEPTTHELKVWTRFWSALESGQKNFEVRYNDRDFQAGDTLWLRDYNPYGGGIYSGKECWRTISYVFDGRDCAGLGVEPGYVILGLADERKAEVKPIAELIAKAREFVDDYEPEQGEPEIEERGVFRALADALESQAKRIAELKRDVTLWHQRYEQEHRALLERLNFTGANELVKTARIASLESQLKVAQLAAEELILRHPDNEKPASLANTIKLAAGLIRTQSAATERAASLEARLERGLALCDEVEAENPTAMAALKQGTPYEVEPFLRHHIEFALEVRAALEGTQQC